MNQRFYLDYNATAPLRPEVREAVAAALVASRQPLLGSCRGQGGALGHRGGARRRWRLSSARGSEDVIFTSGGTEANALALAAQSGGAWHCYLSAIEHPSVLSGGRFYRETTTTFPVTPDGVADLEILANELEKHHLGGWRPFVSLMAANNETGAIQPVAEASKIVHSAGGLLHTDAVQAAGRIRLDMTALGADMLSLSAHKIGGPKGSALSCSAPALRSSRSSRAAARSGAGGQARRMSPALSASAWRRSCRAPILPRRRRWRR